MLFSSWRFFVQFHSHSGQPRSTSAPQLHFWPSEIQASRKFMLVYLQAECSCYIVLFFYRSNPEIDWLLRGQLSGLRWSRRCGHPLALCSRRLEFGNRLTQRGHYLGRDSVKPTHILTSCSLQGSTTNLLVKLPSVQRKHCDVRRLHTKRHHPRSWQGMHSNTLLWDDSNYNVNTLLLILKWTSKCIW